MKLVIAAAALAALVMSPWTLSSSASAQTPTAKQSAKKKKVVAVAKPHVRRASPYSTNPEHDVYVNGEYAGSDPDPRIRWSIRSEWIGRFNMD
jgi:hypothetical protein